MKFMYPAIFTLEEGAYWVAFPDIEGCFSDGDTPEEAMSNAQEALSLHLTPEENEEPTIPKPSNINDIKQPEHGFVSYVTVDIDLTKSSKYIRKNLTIPEWLNDRAVQKGVNFSQTLQEALIKQLY